MILRVWICRQLAMHILVGRSRKKFLRQPLRLWQDGGQDFQNSENGACQVMMRGVLARQIANFRAGHLGGRYRSPW